MKTCRQIERDNHDAWKALYDQYNKDIDEAKRKEFPIGSKVKWRNGSNQVKGKVVGYPSWNPECVTTETLSTKNHSDIKAHLLDKYE